MPIEKSAATVTIHRANDMTKKGRKAVAAWLRRQAEFLEQHGDQLAQRFTARYLYR
jgi:FixJ family two-component response regulator